MSTTDVKGSLLYFRWRVAHNPERLVRAIVWVLPHSWIMWAFYRVWANATSGPFGNEHPDSLTWHAAIDRWVHHEGGDPSFRRSP